MTKKIISIPEGKICDYIDGAFRKDTPEEYVRQTIEKRLVNEHHYDPSRIRVEYRIVMGSGKKRADLVIFPEDAIRFDQSEIFIIIECKKENISPSNKKDGVEQLKSYMAACTNSEWGMWTNSKEKFVFKKYTDEKGTIKFKEYNDIPAADGTEEDVNRPTRATLKNAVDDNLLFVFKTCHNHIYVNEGLQKQPAFFELLKLIFCKIEDERNLPNSLEFYATSEERSNPDGQLSVKKRITGIFNRVKKQKKNARIFTENDSLKLKPRTLAYIVSELQPYSLLETRIDIKGKAYEEIVGANLRGDRGEFFTPRNVMQMTVKMINPSVDERVLDSSCGTGGFLITAMTHAIDQLKEGSETDFGKPSSEWTYSEKTAFRSRISDMAKDNYFGFDINPDLVKATKMNMVMNNDGSGNILNTNSLLPPHEWDEDFKARLASALDVSKSNFTSESSLSYFDVVVTNPPFGSKIPIIDPAILKQFDLAHIWYNENGTWKMTDRMQRSVPPEILFIERCTQFLKPGGRMGIILPDALLGSPGTGYIREWLIQHTRIIASVDLHADTFQPRNGTQTSVLILEKKTEKQKRLEETNGVIADYSIFMAVVDKIGHDKRGNTLFKRDKDGNDILVDDYSQEIDNQYATKHKTRVVDDQTLLLPALFANWKKEEGIAW